MTIDVLLMPGDTARANHDYVPFSGSNGEVEFGENEMEAQLELLVQPDMEQEGAESLHVHISEAINARIGSPDTLKITILDASECKATFS